MNEKTNDIRNLIGKYLGRTLDSEGKKDNGTEYKKYKLQFQVDDKTLNFNCFMPWTKKDGSEKKGVNPDKLVEAEYYKIGFTEYEGKTQKGEPFVSKTIISLFDSGEPEENQLGNDIYKNVNEVIVLPTKEQLDQLITKYKQAVPSEIKSLNHFVGTMLMSVNEHSLKMLLDTYRNQVE